LAEDIGEYLTPAKLLELVSSNKGISCVCFMGGDSNPGDINGLAAVIRCQTNLKIAWYSGRQYIPEGLNLSYFDFC
jgi:anaerobic ribonucleoside-triphosphate reductase activating protein